MNNLLQSLSSQRLRLNIQDGDLKRLLSAVKDGRGHDAKLSDAFYDSLEGILLDLRSVTIDNHDAEAFLKPVSKTDYPDYYEIIKEPMDLQTMLRKVKQKQYKSKVEFQDDLELIWSNCFLYNTGDHHPLRMCANRLKQKSLRLLKNITDRRDRLEPPVPSLVDARTNGVVVNGHARRHSATPVPRMPIVIKKPAPSRTVSVAPLSPSPQPRREMTFADSPAFVRTATGMSSFAALDREVDAGIAAENVAGPSRLPITERLRQICLSGNESDEDEYAMEAANGDVGDKRKQTNGDVRPRKKARTRLRSAELEPVELWWEATTSTSLMANALPTLTYTSSLSHDPHPPVPLPKRTRKKKKKKRPPPESQSPPKSLLGLINNNIRTLKRVRRIHDKFLALNLSSEEGAGGGGGGMSMEPPDLKPEVEEPEGEVEVDDLPWRSRGTGLDVGEQDADECLRWMGSKVLEHSGFQSTSKAALDVFTGVATEYLFNVGRTLRYLCDKYSQTMNAEEIILHTLFESGITHVRDLERYITDDVVRYGVRLTDLEKKLANAYNDVAVETALDDDAFFNEDEEEDGELVMGNFADAYGDDFLGLRELGIASELGLQNLTIPRKLLRGKNKQRNALDGAKPFEPPPPYPPPPPFNHLDSTRIDTQIGLLRPFYIQRLNAHAARIVPAQPPPFISPPAPALSALEIELAREMGQEPIVAQPPPVRNPAAPPIALPDDAPPASRTKSGPLGQIVRPATGVGKKKVKTGGAAKESVHGPAGPAPGIAPPPSLPPPPNSNQSEGFAVLPGSSGVAAAGSSEGGKNAKKENRLYTISWAPPFD